MIPKFANPHSLSQDVESTTRSEIAERAGFTSVVHDEGSLQHDLDTLLRDTWADVLAATSRPSSAKIPRDIPGDKDDQLTFRLLSSMKRPQRISLNPKTAPRPSTRAPDCEDDSAQAETRRIRSLSVAVESDSLGQDTVSARRVGRKSITVGAKISLADRLTVKSLPPFLVTEEVHGSKTTQRVQVRDPLANAASPHEPRLSCTVLPVMPATKQREMTGRKRTKPVRERPPPTYWRPSPEQRGKCMGYALGYPSNWAPDQRYVRDSMKQGVAITSTCHAVPGNA